MRCVSDHGEDAVARFTGSGGEILLVCNECADYARTVLGVTDIRGLRGHKYEFAKAQTETTP